MRRTLGLLLGIFSPRAGRQARCRFAGRRASRRRRTRRGPRRRGQMDAWQPVMGNRVPPTNRARTACSFRFWGTGMATSKTRPGRPVRTPWTFRSPAQRHLGVRDGRSGRGRARDPSPIATLRIPTTDGSTRSTCPPAGTIMGCSSPSRRSSSCPIANSKVAPPRIQFGVNWVLPWKAWCELQPSISSAGRFSCDFNDDAACTDGTMHVQCGRDLLCSGICVCTASGCSAGERNDTLPCNWINFDLRFEGSAASGSMKLGCVGVNNVHLQRAP